MSGVKPSELCDFVVRWCGRNPAQRIWVSTVQFYLSGVEAKGDGPERWAQSVGLQCSRAKRKGVSGWYVWKEKEVDDG